MDVLARLAVGLLALLVIGGAGCRSHGPFVSEEAANYYQVSATAIEFPDVADDIDERVEVPAEPPSIVPEGPREEWPLSLHEVIRIGLANSKVMRQAGGQILLDGGSQQADTIYDVAVQQSSTSFGAIGPEAALSAFDAQFNSVLRFNRNQRAVNNAFFAGGTNVLLQNTANFQAEISKRAATGTQFFLRNITDYDRNNAPTNLFRSAYDTQFEAGLVHPLLQGSGIRFNRIAGPGATPGNYNGVLIGRINTDVTIAEFERAVRDYVLELEQNYWQLYFAYRDLDAKTANRDGALRAWRIEKERFAERLARRQDEALVRAAYFAADAAVENALRGTRSSGLLVATSDGVYPVERRLRRLMGLPDDGRLIRPTDEPTTAKVIFDWNNSVTTAQLRRVELRGQQWRIKRRELELVASKNFLRMRLDFDLLYRFRGFGDDLLDNSPERFSSAFDNLSTGEFQEWQMGLQLSTPVGNRIGHTAVRNAQWQLARDRAVHEDMRLQIIHDLGSALTELQRAEAVTRAHYNQQIAAHQRLESVQAAFEAEQAGVTDLLDAQRSAMEADNNYYRALVDYNLAITNVHLQRGTLLDYNRVRLSESPWTLPARKSAVKQSRRFVKHPIDYRFQIPGPLATRNITAPLDWLLSGGIDGGQTPAPKTPEAEEVEPQRPLPEPRQKRPERTVETPPSPKRPPAAVPSQPPVDVPSAAKPPNWRR